MSDILFKTDNYIFSYRVGGLLIHNGKVLMQKAVDDDGYAFIGGHVAFGETTAETIVREFKEEIGADIVVGDLKWVAEVFFPWGDKPCHQICLYYMVEITNPDIPMEGVFRGVEQMEGRKFELEFHWVRVEEARHLELYPTNARELLQNLDTGVAHFVYQEA